MARKTKQKDVDSQIGKVQFNSQEAFIKWLEVNNVPIETIITPNEYIKKIGVPVDVSREQLEELVSRFHKAFYEHRLDSKAFKEYLDYAYRLFPVEYSGHNRPIGYLFGEVAGVDMEKLGQMQSLLARYRGTWTAKSFVDQLDELASQAFTAKQYQEFKNLDSPVLKRNYIDNICDEYKLNTYSDINKFLSSRTSWDKIKTKITKTFNKNKVKAPSSIDELLADEKTKKLETTKLMKYLIQANRLNEYLVEHKRDLEAFDEIKSMYYEQRPHISERKLKDKKQDKDTSWLNPEELGELEKLGFETAIFREQFYSGARVRKSNGTLSNTEVDEPLSGYTLGSAKRAVMAVDGLTSTIMEKYALDRLGLLKKDEEKLNLDDIQNQALKTKIEKVLCRNGENVQDMVKIATDRAVQINEIIDSTFDVFNKLYPNDSLLNDKNLKTNVGAHKDKLDDFKRQVLRTSIYYGALAKKDDKTFHHAMVQTFTDPALTSRYFNSEFLYALDRKKLYQTNYPESIIKYKDFDGKEKTSKAGELERANSYAVISYEDKTYFVKDIPVITSFDKEGKVSDARLCMSDEEFDDLIRSLTEEYKVSFGDLSRKHITVGSNAFAQLVSEKIAWMEQQKQQEESKQQQMESATTDKTNTQPQEEQTQDREPEGPAPEGEQEEQAGQEPASPDAEQEDGMTFDSKLAGAFKYFINNEAYLKTLEKKSIASGYRPVHGVSSVDELVGKTMEEEINPTADTASTGDDTEIEEGLAQEAEKYNPQPDLPFEEGLPEEPAGERVDKEEKQVDEEDHQLYFDFGEDASNLEPAADPHEEDRPSENDKNKDSVDRYKQVKAVQKRYRDEIKNSEVLIAGANLAITESLKMKSVEEISTKLIEVINLLNKEIKRLEALATEFENNGYEHYANKIIDREIELEDSVKELQILLNEKVNNSKDKKRAVGKAVAKVRADKENNNPTLNERKAAEEEQSAQNIESANKYNQDMLSRTRAKLGKTQEPNQDKTQQVLLSKFMEREELEQELKAAKIAKTNANRHLTSVKNTQSEIESWVVSLKSNTNLKQAKILTEKEEELQKADLAYKDAQADYNNKSRIVNELSAKLLLLNTEIKKLQDGKTIPQTAVEPVKDTAENQAKIEDEKPDWQKKAEEFNKRTNAAERLANLRKQKDELSLDGVEVPELEEYSVDVNTDLDLSDYPYDKEYDEAEKAFLPISNGSASETSGKTGNSSTGKDSIVVTGNKDEINKLKKELEEQGLKVSDDTLSLD